MLCVYVMFVVCVCMTCMEMYMHIYCVCVIYMCVYMVYVCMLCVRCSGMIYCTLYVICMPVCHVCMCDPKKYMNELSKHAKDISLS